MMRTQSVFISKFVKKRSLNVELLLHSGWRATSLWILKEFSQFVLPFLWLSYPYYITFFATNHGDSPREKIGGTDTEY